MESRQCQNGDCTGPSKRYSSCNITPCPPDSMDYRLEQCSRYNSIPFERKLYEWIPYLKAPRKCELNCMPKGERFYYRHEKKVNILKIKRIGALGLEVYLPLSTFSRIFLEMENIRRWWRQKLFLKFAQTCSKRKCK